MYCIRSIGHFDCEVSIAIPFWCPDIDLIEFIEFLIVEGKKHKI